MRGKSRRRSRPALVLDGKERRRRYLIRVRNRAVWLTASLFRALCQLIAACTYRKPQPVQVSPMTIMRLRKEIDHRIGRRGVGKTIIRTAGCSKYTLGLALSQVDVTASFRKVPVPGLVRVGERRRILRRCRRS